MSNVLGSREIRTSFLLDEIPGICFSFFNFIFHPIQEPEVLALSGESENQTGNVSMSRLSISKRKL
jgi:hypothetical protein